MGEARRGRSWQFPERNNFSGYLRHVIYSWPGWKTLCRMMNLRIVSDHIEDCSTFSEELIGSLHVQLWQRGVSGPEHELDQERGMLISANLQR